MENTTYISPSQGEMSVSAVIDQIVEFMHIDPQSFYRLVIGSDSQNKRSGEYKGCDFVTAIVVHRVGTGARYFWHREKSSRIPTLREKIYTETNKSLETAHAIVPDLRAKLNGAKYEFEIHIDVGKSGPTREIIHEVVGMVQGMGYVAKTKPDSWAASSAADRHT